MANARTTLIVSGLAAAAAAGYYAFVKKDELFTKKTTDDVTEEESEDEANPHQLVVDSWEVVKAIDNYEEVAGELLFKRIFEINPEAAAIFKFTDGYETTDEALYAQEAFKKHATAVVSSVTAAVGLLESGDLTTLVTVLKEFGAKHLAAGLQLEKAHYDLVGQALLDTLAAALAAKFTPKVKQAWTAVYGVITENMMAGAAEFSS
eukprot:CAMPEP_0168814526 /NCGR_PEP_ID=MMETSP0726-20121227/5723_1 /TAXON_ID=265536 /ORGANISM="Amphiprora sp., Strain CCMP467" /LENGTH=205 /DNA_ID=CAMNT_0008866697 /DNA_START=37 /DNA_END=654 /DNA_ORIENTATION=+